MQMSRMTLNSACAQVPSGQLQDHAGEEVNVSRGVDFLFPGAAHGPNPQQIGGLQVTYNLHVGKHWVSGYRWATCFFLTSCL